MTLKIPSLIIIFFQYLNCRKFLSSFDILAHNLNFRSVRFEQFVNIIQKPSSFHLKSNFIFILIYLSRRRFVVFSLNRYIFWNEIKYTDSLMPISIIKRADCSGSNVYNLTAEIPTVVDNLAIDPFKSNLYFLNRYNKSLERVTYYGLEMFTVFEVSVSIVRIKLHNFDRTTHNDNSL